VTSKIQHKALVKLMDLAYQIQYKKGITNATADALSRCVSQEEVVALSKCIPSWVQKLRDGYADHAEDKQLLTELAVNTQNEKGFALKDGVIKFQERVWVGHNVLAQ
jgi:hypothetical protein